MSIECLVFLRPYGDRRTIELRNINLEDEIYFKEKGVKLSMESDGRDGHILYADIGLTLEDGTTSEIIHISKPGEDCNAAMASLRKLVEEAYAKAQMS